MSREGDQNYWCLPPGAQANPKLDASLEGVVIVACNVTTFLRDVTATQDFSELLTENGQQGLCAVLGMVSDALGQLEASDAVRVAERAKPGVPIQ